MIAVVLVAVLLSAVLVARLLITAGGDPTVTVTFGEDIPEITQYAEKVLGREVIVRPDAGHDGKYFFVQAMDPWLLEPDSNVALVDRPSYRAQRMLYPTIAGVGGALSVTLLPWSMIILNMVGMGLGSWAVARIALELGGSPWWGLAFVLNPGFISELQIDGGGVLAAAAAFWALFKLMNGRMLAGVVLLTLAVLSREAMLLVALGVGAFLWWRDERRASVAVVAVPVGVAGAWAIYVRLRVGLVPSALEINELGLPFEGLIDSFERMSNDVVHMVARVGILILFVLYLIQAWRHRRLMLAWAFVGFIPLGLVFTRIVWASYFDITRAIAPLLTAFFLLYFVAPRRQSDDTPALSNEAAP